MKHLLTIIIGRVIRVSASNVLNIMRPITEYTNIVAVILMSPKDVTSDTVPMVQSQHKLDGNRSSQAFSATR